MGQNPGTPDDKIPQIHDAAVLKLLEQQDRGKFPCRLRMWETAKGYAVLAMIVGKNVGQAVGQFLHDRIFVPRKMSHTLAYEQGKERSAAPRLRPLA